MEMGIRSQRSFIPTQHSIWQRRKGPSENGLYRPRRPESSAYYQCVEDHFEEFERVYEERFERAYGFYRPYLSSVIYRYLDCGVIRNGFARVRCGECGHEYLLAFLLPKASGGVWRMGVRRGFEKSSPSPFCLQHPQDPPALFSL